MMLTSLISRGRGSACCPRRQHGCHVPGLHGRHEVHGRDLISIREGLVGDSDAAPHGPQRKPLHFVRGAEDENR